MNVTFDKTTFTNVVSPQTIKATVAPYVMAWHLKHVQSHMQGSCSSDDHQYITGAFASAQHCIQAEPCTAWVAEWQLSTAYLKLMVRAY